MMVMKRTVKVALVIGILLTAGFLKAQSKPKETRILKVYNVPSNHADRIAKAIFDLHGSNEDVVKVSAKDGSIHVLATEQVHKFVREIIWEFVIERFDSKETTRFLFAQIAELRRRVAELEQQHEK